MGITVAKTMMVACDKPSLLSMSLLPPLVVMEEDEILMLAIMLLEDSALVSAFCWAMASLDAGEAVVLT
jgi:hypothetical protein